MYLAKMHCKLYDRPPMKFRNSFAFWVYNLLDSPLFDEKHGSYFFFILQTIVFELPVISHKQLCFLIKEKRLAISRVHDFSRKQLASIAVRTTVSPFLQDKTDVIKTCLTRWTTWETWCDNLNRQPVDLACLRGSLAIHLMRTCALITYDDNKRFIFFLICSAPSQQRCT